MNRFTLIALTLLLHPCTTFAALESPIAVLDSMQNTHVPFEYTFQAHNNVDGVYTSLWARGAYEGSGLSYKQSSNVSIHVEDPHGKAMISLKLISYQGTLYVRIIDGSIIRFGEIFDIKHSLIQNPFAAIPETSVVADQAPFPFIDILRHLQLDTLGLTDAISGLILHSNEKLALIYNQYEGGHAYALKSSAPAPNTHIKLNTDNEGNTLFTKIYLQDGSFVMEGMAQPHGEPVYVDVPKHTMTEEDYFREIEFHDIYPAIWKHNLGYPATWIWDSSPLPFPDMPSLLPPADAMWDYPECTAEPKSKEYIEQQRKGSCPGERFSKRSLHDQNLEEYNPREAWEDRIKDEHITEAYNKHAIRFEETAQRRDAHSLKLMLSKLLIQDVGSDHIDLWLDEELIPFFRSFSRTLLLEALKLEDEFGNEGVALHKVLQTNTGLRKDYVIFLFEEDRGAGPVVTDVFVNKTPEDLREMDLLD